jgi:hypothetical protein
VIVPDANLLLYAYDAASPFHTGAARWWSDVLSGNEPVGLTHPALFAFMRIATSARVFEAPMKLAEAGRCVNDWLERGVARVLLPDENHTGLVLSLLHAAGGTGGNLVTDAQIAALAMAYQGTVHTSDRDFLRFEGLRSHYPLAAGRRRRSRSR